MRPLALLLGTSPPAFATGGPIVLVFVVGFFVLPVLVGGFSGALVASFRKKPTRKKGFWVGAALGLGVAVAAVALGLHR